MSESTTAPQPAGIEWADPPRTQRRRRPTVLSGIAAELRENPGKWAKLPGRAGRIRQAKEEGFEATTRGKDLYVRWPEPAA